MGQVDIPPVDEALEEAKLAAKRCVGKPSYVVSSPLKRARITAEIFASRFQVPMFTSSLWSERNWGPYEGQPKSFRQKCSCMKGVEDSEVFIKRITSALNNISSEGEAMVVSHSGVYRALTNIGYKSSFENNTICHALPIKLALIDTETVS